MMTSPRGQVVVHDLPYPDSSADLFRKIRHLPLPVFLDSGHEAHRHARFDMLSAAPGRVLRSRGNRTAIHGGDGVLIRLEDGDPFDILAAEFTLDHGNKPLPGLPFTGGALGYFGYELMHPGLRIDPAQERDVSLPDMLVGLYGWALVVDHGERRCTLVFQPDCPGATRDRVMSALSGPVPEDNGDFRLLAPFSSNFSREQYAAVYHRIIDYIQAGDCYQVNLAQRFSAPCRGDAWHVFERLQARASAPFAAFMEDGDSAVLSFSPERFLQVRDLAVTTQPIKGTRPRGRHPAEDDANRRALESSAKDRAENLMIVDLLRNDLGRICDTGTIAVPALFETQSFTNVHHLVSTITGRLKRPGDVFALLRAGFPGGSVTGTPKIRAMEVINELETAMRSVYCGAFAYIDVSGNMDSNICIRTLVMDQDRIHCWGGGAIVADSRPDLEYQESLDKISLFMEALQ